MWSNLRCVHVTCMPLFHLQESSPLLVGDEATSSAYAKDRGHLMTTVFIVSML